MNTHTHTPGKWEILKADRSECNESEGKDMAGCLTSGDRIVAYFPTLSAMSNADLISAAPDLLAACRQARETLISAKALLNSCGAALGMGQAFAMLENAIAKAEGGEA